MKPSTPLEDANNLIIQHVVRQYLLNSCNNVRTVEGACVVMRRIGNRHGLPADAITYFFEIEHIDLGFAFDVRAVWRDSDLLKPVAVHTKIVDLWDKSDYGSDSAVSLAVNTWLQSL